MKVQTVANGNVCIVISPENTMEEEILKQLMKQGDNEIMEIRTGVRLLEKQINTGILIGKVGTTVSSTASQKDEDQEEEL